MTQQHPNAPFFCRWPYAVWEAAAARSWRRPAPVPARPDYAKIALLEYELFGIEPKPGTAAAAVVNLQRAFAPQQVNFEPRQQT